MINNNYAISILKKEPKAFGIGFLSVYSINYLTVVVHDIDKTIYSVL